MRAERPWLGELKDNADVVAKATGSASTDPDFAQRLPRLSAPTELVTERLRLRCWQDADRPLFAAMNRDLAVMRYFAGLQSAEASDRSIDAWQAALMQRGWSNWAVERRDGGGDFIGFVGLSVPKRVFAFSPCVEIGWRLAAAHWGQGFATEAARAVLALGFEALGLAEIVSFTSLRNTPSRAVMARIGMVDSGQDFDHPALPEGSDLRRHALYRLARADWLALHDGRAGLAASR